MSDIPTTPNPHNFRQRIAKLSDKVDPENPERDGDVVPDDPSLTRMANLVRYMRRNEMYLPPNPWPEAMLLYGLDREGLLSCMFFLLLRQFETIPHEDLFAICAPDTVRLYFVPMPEMPSSNEAAQEWIREYMVRTSPEEFSRQTLYLALNRWWVDKHDTGTPGDTGRGETDRGGVHHWTDTDESRPDE